jgi:hypothetical protein
VIGNITVPGPPNAAGGAPTSTTVQQQRPAPKVSPQQALASMTPQTKRALQAIPQSTWQQLHGAGLIHPALMQHLSG